MNRFRTALCAAAATAVMAGAAQAQESNPVTSNPPVDSIGRNSETSPGTPNRQNSAPGVRGRYYYGQSYEDYGPAYYGPSYGPSYGTYYDPPSIVVTPGGVYVD